jgi:lysozyme
MRIDALDLSHWNEVDSFAEVADAGVVGVLHKATEGHTYTDKTYADRMRNALDAGLKWGAYHFLKHGKAAEQMKHFLKYAELPPGSRVAIDYEDPLCTLTDLHEAVAAIAGLDSSMQICIYAGSLLKEQLGDKHDRQLARTSLWLAQYNANPAKISWPKGTWKHWSLWQYTDGSVGGEPRAVPGVEAPMDCNQFNGEPEHCVQWFGPVEEDDSDKVA